MATVVVAAFSQMQSRVSSSCVTSWGKGRQHDEAWHSVVQVVRPLLPPEAVVYFDVPMQDTKLQLAPAKLLDVHFGSSTFSGPAFRTWQPT
eukprot:1291373-Rhodomonas_salina.1